MQGGARPPGGRCEARGLPRLMPSARASSSATSTSRVRSRSILCPTPLPPTVIRRHRGGVVGVSRLSASSRIAAMNALTLWPCAAARLRACLPNRSTSEIVIRIVPSRTWQRACIMQPARGFRKAELRRWAERSRQRALPGRQYTGGSAFRAAKSCCVRACWNGSTDRAANRAGSGRAQRIGSQSNPIFFSS